MTFLILLFVLSGVALIASGVEHQPLKTFLLSWIGNGNG